MNNYQDRVNSKLDDIARTVDKLDGTLAAVQETDSRVKSYFEQQKALHEVKTILRRADDIEDIRRSQAQHDIDTIGTAEGKQDEALNKINNQVMKLDSTLDRMQDTEDKVRSYVEQRKALHEIKRILNLQGRYNSYEENELSALGDLVN